MKKKLPALSLGVIVIIWEYDILKNHIERIADQDHDLGYKHKKLYSGFKLMDTSSIEVYVKTGISISKGQHFFNVDLLSNFLFTCTKEKDENYSLQWSFSLS